MPTKKLLVLGGTHFIGKAFVESLLENNEGFDITLFNRGITDASIFPHLRKIKGDRETEDLDKVVAENWDCIIDINGYYPNSLEAFIPKLKDKVGRYIYISTVSVYDAKAYLGKVDLVNEDSQILSCTPEQRVGDWSAHYGEKKAECERILISHDWLDKVIIRPSIVYGKYDYTERYYYWLQRFKKRDLILIPENGKERANLTFVNDLARLIKAAISVASHRTIYNGVTHAVNSLHDKLEVIASVSGRTPEYLSISAEELTAKGFQIPRAFPCNFGRDYLIYDISRTQTDFGAEITGYTDSIASTYDYYNRTSDWKIGSQGLRYEEEDDLIASIVK